MQHSQSDKTSSFFFCICALDLSNTVAWQRIPDIFLCEIGNDRWASSQTRGSKRRGQASRGRVTCSWFHNLRGSSEQRKLLPDVGFSKDSKVKVQLQIRLLVTSLKRTKRLSNVLEKKMCICWSGMKILSEALGKNTLFLWRFQYPTTLTLLNIWWSSWRWTMWLTTNSFTAVTLPRLQSEHRSFS